MKNLKSSLLIIPIIIFSCKLNDSKNIKSFEKIGNKIYFNFNCKNKKEEYQSILKKDNKKLLATLPIKEYFQNPTNNVFFKVLKKDIKGFADEVLITLNRKSRARMKIKKIKNNNELDEKLKLDNIIRISIFEIEDENYYAKFLKKVNNSTSISIYDNGELNNFLKGELKKMKINIIKAGFAVFIGPILWIPLLVIPYVGICLWSVGIGIVVVSLGFEIHNYKCTKKRIDEFLLIVDNDSISNY